MAGLFTGLAPNGDGTASASSIGPGASLRTRGPAMPRIPSNPRSPGDSPEKPQGDSKDFGKGYMEAAGVGLEQEGGPPFRPQGASPRLQASSPRTAGNNSPTLYGESTTSSMTSDLQYSDFGDADPRMQEDRGASAALPPMPLLKADPPTPVGNTLERYSVHIRRASLKQRYGVSFDAAETVDRRLWAITIAEDLPHLGICKGDQVMTLNHIVPRSVDECRQTLEQAMAINLVLQRRQPDKWANRPSPKAVGGILLSVTQATITDAMTGEFRLTMHRSSQRQRFGLVFEPVPPTSRGEELAIKVADDMPHVALRRGDRLMSLNGVRVRSKKACAQILGTAMNLNMILRREHGGLVGLAHEVEPIDDYQEVQYGPSTASMLSCCVQSQEYAHGFGTDEHEPIVVAAPVLPTPGRSARHIAQGEIVGYDAMGGAIEAGDAGCGLFPMCRAPEPVAVEHISDGLTYPAVSHRRYSGRPPPPL